MTTHGKGRIIDCRFGGMNNQTVIDGNSNANIMDGLTGRDMVAIKPFQIIGLNILQHSLNIPQTIASAKSFDGY